MDFVNYGWGSDNEEENEDWTAYKSKHKYKSTNKQGKANLKRQFYSREVDKDFEKTMMIGDEEEIKAFNAYCAEHNSLGEIGYLPQNSDMILVNCKRWCHTLYLLLLPMGIPFSWVLPFFASLLALCFKRNGKHYRLLSEEVTNIALVGVQGMCGPLMKFVIQLTLGLWSLLHATDLARARLDTDPQTPGLIIFAPYLDQIAYSKVELV